MRIFLIIMDLFSDFCNICYKVNDGTLKDCSEDIVKHLKDVLITFVGHADIIKLNEIYLCQFCCEELIRFEKFKDMCFNNLIKLRQTYFNMLSELELEDDSAAVKNTLKRFVHEKVLRRNCLPKDNCSILISTEQHEIVKSSEDLNITKPVFNKQVINLQSQRHESEFDGDCSDVSYINNVTKCGETLDAITIEEEIKNEMMSLEEIKLEIFKSESNEDDVSDINNANVSDTSQIEFTKEDFDLNNKMERCHPEHFKLNIVENELGEHAHTDLKVPVVNSGINPTKQELHVKQENSALERLELETTEEFGGRLNVAFEITNVHTIVNMENCGNEDIRSGETIVGKKLGSGRCNNKSIASIMNSQQNRPPVRQNRQGKCPASLQSGVHNRRNQAGKPHLCTLCNKSFRTKHNLTVHKRTHSGEKPYKCTVCNKAFTQLAHLIVHQRVHNDDKPYKCTVCKKAFQSVPILIVHERIHSSERPHKCTVCNKTFRRSCDLSQHTRIHSGDRPYKCSMCNKAFATSSNLSAHNRIHRGDKPYNCTVCNKTFTLLTTMTRHKRTHNGDRPYKCTVCNKAFTALSSLNVHGRIHSGEMPYKCTVCKKAFGQLSGLTRHKRMHTGERPYKCTVCNKAFTMSYNLNTHERIHSGDRPFECTVCNKKFTHQSSLIVHKRKHSGD